jgi:hypothetical protein
MDRITLKGHSSFYIREGWLAKGLEIDDVNIFRDSIRGTEILGVGTTMVKAIRYYLTATNLKNNLSLANEIFGELVKNYDPFFELYTTKFLVHYNLVCNENKATSWYLFFNHTDFDGMTKDEISNSLDVTLQEMKPNTSYSRKSLEDDVSCILHSYITKSYTHEITPEDNYRCPLADLKLLDIDSSHRIIKSEPIYDTLDMLVILYVIINASEEIDNQDFVYQTSVDRLLNDPKNIGRVFNLSRTQIYKYLEELQDAGYLTIHKTAGLDQIYIKKRVTLEEVLSIDK